MADDKELIEWLKDDIEEIKGDIKAMNKSLTDFMVNTCADRHTKVDDRMTRVETRMNLFAGGVILFMVLINLFKNPIVKFLGGG